MDDDTDVLRMEDDYYSFLNLSKTATNDEINNAYRRFSRMYHPDKHVDPEQKKKAEILFNKTKKAYEVLSDAHQRAIYDSLGTRGLETEGWEIVQRTKTPQEIREEYERLAREREERRLQQSTNPKGSISVAINATDLFNRYKDEYDLIDEGVLPVIEVSGMTINQSIEAPITLRDTVTLSGNISTQNGTGSGAINVASRRITSERGWAEVEVGAGNGPMFTFRGFRTLTRALCVSGGAIMQFTERGIKPSLVSTFACQFDGQSVGYLTYRCSGISSSAMSTTYVCNTEKYHASVSLQFGIPHSFISATYTRKMLQAELKLRISVKAGTFGAVAEYGVEKKVSQHSTISATVSFGVPSGVMLKIRITRATQSFIFPIHLCEEIIPAPIFYATMVPIATWLTVKRFMIDPINKEKERREKERTLETNRKRIFEMQKEARAALDLMQETYVRIKSEEEKKKGLIINKAYYGKMSESLRDQLLSTNEIENDASPLHIDPIPLELFEVTIQLQCLIKDSKLVLQESSKAQLPGFFDPCVGEEKFLIIHYQFLHHQYCCCISDLESLRLPKQTHRISRA